MPHPTNTGDSLAAQDPGSVRQKYAGGAIPGIGLTKKKKARKQAVTLDPKEVLTDSK